jgi:hypothetical protein
MLSAVACIRPNRRTSGVSVCMCGEKISSFVAFAEQPPLQRAQIVEQMAARREVLAGPGSCAVTAAA